MTYLRKEAKGRECQVRIPCRCNGNPETTVLAHVSNSAMGMKAHDIFGAWSCSDCHDILDGRTKTSLSYAERRLYHIDGVIRTQAILLGEGKIKI